VEEHPPWRPCFAVEGGDQGRHRLLLLGQQLRAGGGGRQTHLAGNTANGKAAGGDQPPLLEAPQRLAVGADRRRQLPGRHLPRAQRLQDGALLGAEALAAAEDSLARGQDLGSQLGLRAHRPPRAAGPGPRRQHQLQAPRGGRAVLAGDPEPEAHQLRRRPGLQGLDRLGQALGRQLGGLGDLDHHPQQPPRPEGDADDAADPQIRHRLRAAVVEGAAQGTRGGQGLDPQNRHPDEVMGDRGCSGLLPEEALSCRP
jgi:hypothetical protein